MTLVVSVDDGIAISDANEDPITKLSAKRPQETTDVAVSNHFEVSIVTPSTIDEYGWFLVQRESR